MPGVLDILHETFFKNMVQNTFRCKFFFYQAQIHFCLKVFYFVQFALKYLNFPLFWFTGWMQFFRSHKCIDLLHLCVNFVD